MAANGDGGNDRSVALQQGTREFAGVYERNAYLVYNLALRTTVDRAAAIDAACAAFLASLGSEDPDAELVKLTIRRALPGARQMPTLEAAGDAEAQAMLRATASLPAPERAALALVGLSNADAPQVAAAVEATEESAANLIGRAWSSFGQAARLPAEQAEKAYRGWLWAEPPPELWERLYPSFYAQLLRRLKTDGEGDASAIAVAATVAAAATEPSRRERRRAHRAEKDARRRKPPGALRRVVRAIPVGRLVLLLMIAGAGAGAAYGTGMIGGKHSASTTGLGFTTPTRKLSPAEIARLRAQERQASLAYAAQQRQARKQALQQQALEAKAIRGQRLQQLAAERAAAKRQRAAAVGRAKLLAERQRAIQQQLLAQQQPTVPSSPPPPTRSTRSTPSNTTTGNGSKPGSGGNGSGSNGNPTPTQAQQQCLYDPNSGTYVCPQN